MRSFSPNVRDRDFVGYDYVASAPVLSHRVASPRGFHPLPPYIDAPPPGRFTGPIMDGGPYPMRDMSPGRGGMVHPAAMHAMPPSPGPMGYMPRDMSPGRHGPVLAGPPPGHAPGSLFGPPPPARAMSPGPWNRQDGKEAATRIQKNFISVILLGVVPSIHTR